MAAKKPTRAKRGQVAPKEGLLELARAVATDFGQGRVDPDLAVGCIALARSPEPVLILLDLLVEESGRKRPKEPLRDALLFLIGAILSEARMAIESDADGTAPQLVAGLHDAMARMLADGRLPAGVAMSLAQQFAAAKLDFPDDLRTALSDMAMETAEDDPLGPEDMAAQFEGLAEAYGHDPFLIQSEPSEQLSVFPREHLALIVGALATSHVAAMREAALGWLLDRDPKVGAHVAQTVAAAAGKGLVSAQSADRLVLMRPWLTEPVREHVDAAVRACRQRAEQPKARPAFQVVEALASGCDGAGAQSLFVVLKRGRKMAFAAILAKHGFGLRDAWLRDDLTKPQLDEMLNAVSLEMDCFDASVEIVRTALAHALAIGAEQNEPPPFGLVQVLEAVGLSRITPEKIDADALVASLIEAAGPERSSADAVDDALAASLEWPLDLSFTESWFEPDEAASRAVKSARGRARKAEAVLTTVLPSKRRRWGELLAWTAKAAQDQPEDDAWIDFALVARELLGERDLAEIPIAAWIADNTVQAASAR